MDNSYTFSNDMSQIKRKVSMEPIRTVTTRVSLCICGRLSGHYSPLIPSKHLILSSMRSEITLDQTSQADLGLRCSHIPEDKRLKYGNPLAWKYALMCSQYVRQDSVSFAVRTSRKHAYIMMTPLNPTFV